MNAARLALAVEKLRRLTDAAAPGGWSFTSEDGKASATVDYCNAMRPEVAYALADWLEFHARTAAVGHPVAFEEQAQTVARLILGEAS